MGQRTNVEPLSSTECLRGEHRCVCAATIRFGHRLHCIDGQIEDPFELDPVSSPRCAKVQWSDRATLRCLSTTIRLLQDYCFSTRRRSVERCDGGAANPRAQFPCGTPS